MSSRPDLKLAWCSVEAARYACKHWHYSGVLPGNGGVRIGAWENDRFIGAIIYGLGAGNATRGERYGLNRTHEVAELMRVALRDHETPTSRIVAITIRMVKRHSPKLRMLISFADEKGQGHLGRIYQAMNWIYLGAHTGHGGFMLNGEVWHSRSVYSQGWGQSIAWLREHIDPNAYVVKARKHRYAYPLDDEMRQRLLPMAKPYPKHASEAGL